MLLRKFVMSLVFCFVFVVAMPIITYATEMPNFRRLPTLSLEQRELPKHELPDFRLPELTPLEVPELSVDFGQRKADLEQRGFGEDFVLPDIETREVPELKNFAQERLIPENRIIPRPDNSFFGRLRRFTLDRLPSLGQMRIFRPGHDLEAEKDNSMEEFQTEEERKAFLEEDINTEAIDKAEKEIREKQGQTTDQRESVEVTLGLNLLRSFHRIPANAVRDTRRASEGETIISRIASFFD